VALARRQANAAVALAALGRWDKVWPLLPHTPDPTLRSYLIDRLGPGGVEARALIDRLNAQREPDVSARRALLLTLAEFDAQQLLPAEREALAPRLLARYRDDPDPGIHGASGWLLRHWGQQAKVEEIDRELATGQVDGQRQWYVNRQGQTMVVLPQGEFTMGEGQQRKRRRIEHRFALSAREVTVAEFRRFRGKHEYGEQFAPTLDCPVNMVSWYDAAAYCNWLSEQEGIPKEQWCYLPNDRGLYAEGMKVPADFRRRTGYRLPTEEEWEYACRAGTVMGWSMGDADELLSRYAWYAVNADSKTHPVGSERPNDWGLFDLHGNTWEWCHEKFGDKEAINGEEDIKGKSSRLLRGGAFNGPAMFARSAYRIGSAAGYRIGEIGFRPARTFR
jgi:formylglycine-generating enzyme required for sulfatase activity